jgi:hypothetical protein
MFRSKQDGGYQTLVKWLNKLATPEPRYGFSFSLDGAADKPAATSAPTGDERVPAKNPVPNVTPKPTTAPAVIPRVPQPDTGAPRGPAK